MTKLLSLDDNMQDDRRHGAFRRPLLAAMGVLLSCTALTAPAYADDDEKPKEGEPEIVVEGSLGALPLKDVGSVFGFDKTITETPRSASTISKEQMERFGVTDIYDLVSQSPGVFTNSFFGVGGALDIRGTPGEVYFRGVRRLDNPGNYPTPIGASDRIDIVRGPASPIYGPSKTGGYMNFVPKSARVAGGKFMNSPEGEITYTTGSWSKSDLSATIRGPGKIGAQEFGYSLYAELEDSGSYYNNVSTKQTIVQSAFDTDVASNVRVEFGMMYHDYKGVQNGGWNRLTQALVDNGTYITGQAAPVDGNGDGQLAQGEFDAFKTSPTDSPFNPFGGFACGGGVLSTSITPACYTGKPINLVPGTVGTTTLSRRQTLTGKNDKLWNEAWTAYMDVIVDLGNDWEVKNQLFYDAYSNINENAYGFSQFHDSYVIEDKIVLSGKKESDLGKFSFQLSPSVRYTDFLHGDDFNYEYFHRVDLTKGYDAFSDRLLSTECNCDYSNYVKGHYTDYAMAALADLDFNFGLGLTLGGRYDYVDVKSAYDPTKMNSTPGVVSASAGKGDWSWSVSANYKLPWGLIPYATIARQSTIIAGQGAEIYPGDIVAGTFISASRLYEGGIKGSWLGGKLYGAVSVYKQNRTDYSVQSVTVNQAVETEGVEVEARWSVNRHLLLTGSYSMTKVYELDFFNNGSTFSFLGVEDLKRNPSFAGMSDADIGALIFGGQPGALIPIPNREASRRAGIPENIFSATATYAFDNGLSFAGTMSVVDSVFSGQSQAVRLPAYTLVDLSASYKIGKFLFRATMKNALDERYFRANFTELFGSTIVLPERPRSFQASVSYKF